MFQHNINPFTFALPPADGFPEHKHERQYNTALNRFKSMLARGDLFRLKSRLLHRPQRLYDLNVLKPQLSPYGSCYAGLKVVRIGSIVGSEGKVSEFDLGFHPMREESRERWVNMALAYLARLPLPPVQLVQIGSAYFMRDGHHRISVGRAFGQVSMDAEVVTWPAASPLPWESGTLEPKYRTGTRLTPSTN